MRNAREGTMAIINILVLVFQQLGWGETGGDIKPVGFSTQSGGTMKNNKDMTDTMSPSHPDVRWVIKSK